MRRHPQNREAGITLPWLAAIVAGSLLVIGGGAYALTGGFGGDDTSADATTASPSKATPSSKATKEAPAEPTLEEMMAKVKSGSEQLVCTFQVEGEDHEMYIKSFNKFRVNINGPDGKPVGHLLRAGAVAHVWKPNAAVGVTMPIVEDKAPEGAPEDPAEMTPESLEKYGDGTPVSCEPYSGDQSVYSLPGSVSFKPLRELTGPLIP